MSRIGKLPITIPAAVDVTSALTDLWCVEAARGRGPGSIHSSPRVQQEESKSAARV